MRIELQYQITNNQKLIETKQQTINQITYNIQAINIDKELVLLVVKLEIILIFNYQIQEVLESKIEILPKTN